MYATHTTDARRGERRERDQGTHSWHGGADGSGLGSPPQNQAENGQPPADSPAGLSHEISRSIWPAFVSILNNLFRKLPIRVLTHGSRCFS